jgi:hypothetical protein
MYATCACLLALLAVVGASAAGAKENYHEKAINADTKEKFSEVAKNVRKEMEGGGRYEYVKPDERNTIDQKFTEMEALFSDSGSVHGMKPDTKVKLFNDQDVIKSILTHRDRDRVICKNEALSARTSR